MSDQQYKKIRIKHIGTHSIDDMEFLCPSSWTVKSVKEFIETNNEQMHLALVNHKISMVHGGKILMYDQRIWDLPTRNSGELILWMKLDQHSSSRSSKSNQEEGKNISATPSPERGSGGGIDDEEEEARLGNLKRNYFVSILLQEYSEKIGENNLVFSMPVLNSEWSKYIENESEINKAEAAAAAAAAAAVILDPQFPIRVVFHIVFYFSVLRTYFVGNELILGIALTGYFIAEMDAYWSKQKQARERRRQIEVQRIQQEQKRQEEEEKRRAQKAEREKLKSTPKFDEQGEEIKVVDDNNQQQRYDAVHQIPETLNLKGLSSFDLKDQTDQKKVQIIRRIIRRKKKMKCAQRTQFIFSAALELVYCYMISLFPNWNVHNYVTNNPVADEFQEYEETVVKEGEEQIQSWNQQLSSSELAREQLPLDSLTLSKQLSLSPTMELQRDLGEMIDCSNRKFSTDIQEEVSGIIHEKLEAGYQQLKVDLTDENIHEIIHRSNKKISSEDNQNEDLADIVVSQKDPPGSEGQRIVQNQEQIE